VVNPFLAITIAEIVDMICVAILLYIGIVWTQRTRATFVGPRRSFYLFDPKRIHVSVDTSLAGLGRRTFKLAEHNTRFPKEFDLTGLSPSVVKITIKNPLSYRTTRPQMRLKGDGLDL
jgi:hypothetical protein